MVPVPLRAASALAALWLPGPALAHEAGADGDVWLWLIAAALAASAGLYALGVARLWRAAGRGRGVSSGEVAAFAAGWVVLAAALLPPIDAWSERLFSIHMVQHELMMIVAAPLLVMGRPLAPWAWALSRQGRVAAGAAVRNPAVERAWRMAASPLGAWTLHAAALWLWHAPVLFIAARDHPGIHVLQHASFFGSALLFWWALLRPSAPRGVSGAALLYLFTTMVHTGALGALLVFSRTVWYPPATGAPPLWNLAPLDDQQLGGLIMWVPGGLAYLGAALLLLARTLTRSEPREAYR